MAESPAGLPTRVILDFDGTCTQVSAVYEEYLELYRTDLCRLLDVSRATWEAAQQTVRQRSPRAAWMIAGCPAAPAAADPYILAHESAKFIARQHSITLPTELKARALAATPAPWREEAKEVLAQLVDWGVTIAFISNTSTNRVQQRLDELFVGDSQRRSRISAFGDASKFCICELPWDRPSSSAAEAYFAALPAVPDLQPPTETGRPIYLRRGQYLLVIDRVLAGQWEQLSTTVFCGDIWEMDLAMPAALGACVHLIERTTPFDTYDYERSALSGAGLRGKISDTLVGLLDWFIAPQEAKSLAIAPDRLR